ncbi:hypothetical protein LJR225_004184 [Phenylobacterium sp. LjRoot225]|uniref:hypothetical protein n=1 Tax=Phenylobacterium sp. LjRoot225 TaxID=3342285 RepID=UPI003ED1445D
MSYRVYRLNRAGAIISGEWIEAESEQDARRMAHSLCDEGTPSVELWQGPRKVGVFPCSDVVA